MSVYIGPCSIDELEHMIKAIEQRESFVEWCAPVMEQLDKALGKMTDPNSKFPGCWVDYKDKSKNKIEIEILKSLRSPTQ